MYGHEMNNKIFTLLVVHKLKKKKRHIGKRVKRGYHVLAFPYVPVLYKCALRRLF